MRKNIRFIGLLLAILMILSLLAGCSSKSSNQEYSESSDGSYPMEDSMEAPVEESSKDAGLGTIGMRSSIEPDKIITTVSMTFQTTEFNQSLEKLYELVKESQGYLSGSDVYYSSQYNSQMYQRGDFSIRIPREKVNQFKGLIPQIGNLTNESTSKEDVTRYYTDTDSRLKVLEIKEERLLSLLERAENIEDIIKLEDQLSEVIYEKENLKATLVNLDDRIDYSTFNVSLVEVAKVSATETSETSFITRLQNAFENSLYQFKISAENFAVFMVYNLPGFLILLAIIAILYKIIKRIVKGPKEKIKKLKNNKKPTEDELVKEENSKDEKKDDSQD